MNATTRSIVRKPALTLDDSETIRNSPDLIYDTPRRNDDKSAQIDDTAKLIADTAVLINEVPRRIYITLKPIYHTTVRINGQSDSVTEKIKYIINSQLEIF